MRMNVASMICDKNKEFKFKSFSEECFKLCLSYNSKTAVKYGLNHKKIQDPSKFNIRNYNLQKKRMFNT